MCEIAVSAAVALFSDILSKRFHSPIISLFCIIDAAMQLILLQRAGLEEELSEGEQGGGGFWFDQSLYIQD